MSQLVVTHARDKRRPDAKDLCVLLFMLDQMEYLSRLRKVQI